MRQIVTSIFLGYLRIFARIQLDKVKLLQKIKGQNLTVIGITGSSGKSTTMEALSAILSPEFKIKTNYGANSETGIPLSILDIKIDNYRLIDWIKIALLSPIKVLTNWKTYSISILEMGIDGPDEPKNMSYLLKIVRPDISVFLNVGLVHSQAFDKLVNSSLPQNQRETLILEKVAAEKSKIINILSASHTAIVNTNDPYVTKSTLLSPAQKLTFGTGTGNILKHTSVSNSSQGFQYTFTYQNKKYSFCLPNTIYPPIYSDSFAAAFLAATACNLAPEKIIKNLSVNFHSPPSRSSLLKGIKNSLIIDSSYNSSPVPTLEMLKLLSTFPSPKIAVLGDMRELGQQSASAHQKIYKEARNSVDLIVGVGPETNKYFVDNKSNYIFWWQAVDFLKEYLSTHPNSTILFKGSQNTIFLEELIKTILNNPANSSLLCRQSPYWLTLKEKFRRSKSK